MRIYIFLFIVSLLHVSAGTYAQDKKLSIAGSNIELQNLLKEIESQSDFFFFYSNEKIDKSTKININVSNATISDILDHILSGTDITYYVIDKAIILAKKEANVNFLQQKTITGTITDEYGEALPGVNVIIKGTSLGTVTDVNGKYSMNVPDRDAVLNFSFIGYVLQEIVVGDQATIDVILLEDAREIEEVVVVGYGTMRKSDLTGAVGSLKSEEIVRANPVQPAKAIQGQIAGVSITKKNSRPGSDYNIDIRGLSSINYSTEPLVVIDGVMGGNMSMLNPSDIEKMDILKDASATAIYGTRGANGVIIITTKKGIQGKARVTYDGYVGVKVPGHIPEMMNAQEFYYANNDVRIQDGGSPATWNASEKANVESGRSVDWIDEVTDPGLQTGHVISVSGGTENTNYYFSGGYINEKGNLVNTGYQKYSLKGSIDSKLNNVVKVGFTSYYTYSVLDLGSNESLRTAFRARPTGTSHYADLVNPAENNDRDWNGYAVYMGINETQLIHPLIEADPENFQDETRLNSFLGNAYIELTPLKGLSFRSSLSVSTFNNRNGIYSGPYTKTRMFKLANASNSISINGSYTLDNILTYKTKINKHDFTLTAVQSTLFERFETSTTKVENLPYGSYWYSLGSAATINSVGSSLTERSILSYMGRINYIYDNKYLITLTGRYDGLSALADGNKWGFFPSAAFAWRMGEEEFIKNLNVFSDLKLRVSYGLVGNDVVAPYSTQSYMERTAYDFNGVSAYGFSPNTMANQDLSWEKSEEINIGVNMGFLKNRISLDFEFYNRNTRDLIQQIQLPPSLGFENVTANMGKLLNRGVELTLNTVNFARKDFRWTTSINFSTNHNEIKELYGGTVNQDIGNLLFVGKSLKSHYYYKFDGIWQTSEAEEAKKYGQVPGSVKVVDQDSDGKISSSGNTDDRVVLGSELPTWYGGITNSVYYKNFDFSIFAYTRQGVMFRNKMLQGTMGELGNVRYNSLILNYWTTTNPTNDYFGLVAANPYRQAIQYKDASFWRISDITLGYSLPQTVLNKIGISRLRCYLQASNPFIFTDFVSLDPEFNSDTYRDDVPAITFIFGINVSF